MSILGSFVSLSQDGLYFLLDTLQVGNIPFLVVIVVQQSCWTLQLLLFIVY